MREASSERVCPSILQSVTLSLQICKMQKNSGEKVHIVSAREILTFLRVEMAMWLKNLDRLFLSISSRISCFHGNSAHEKPRGSLSWTSYLHDNCEVHYENEGGEKRSSQFRSVNNITIKFVPIHKVSCDSDNYKNGEA